MKPVLRIASHVLALSLVGNAVARSPSAPASLSQPKPVNVFVLSGQSNMEGLGNSRMLPAELATQPGVKIRSAILAGPDPTAWEPLGAGFGVGKGFGPEVAFGHELEKALPDVDIYLIKSARSGTALSKSARVNFDPAGTNNEYAALIRRVKAALDDLEAQGREYSVEAFFWMQGEADALDRHNRPDSAEPSGARYAVNLRNFIESVRSDLQLPDVPVFAGRLPSNLVSTVFHGNTFSNAPLVIAGQDQVARDPEMKTVLISTDDLSLRTDRLHYDTQGQLALGRRFARAYLKHEGLQAADAPAIREPARKADGKAKDGNKAFHDSMVAKFAEQNRTAKPGGMVFVGDSITQGLPTRALDADVPVYNRGISGDKIGGYYYGVLDRMSESVYDLKPSVVFLLIGINNFTYWTTPPGEMERGYERLLAELEENCPAARVYVQSVLPLRGRWAGHNERVREVNAELKGMAGRHGHTFLDIHPFLCDEQGELREELTGDGLHLNAAGYLEWIRHLPGIRLGIETNLTTGKPVTVSGGTQGANLPQLAVDGIANPLSAWWSTPAPQWLKVDLQRPYLLDRIQVFPYWDGGRFYQYTVEVSSDGHDWMKVADRSTNTSPSTANGDLCRFGQAEARYIRVNMLKNSANPAVHLVELRAFEAGKQ